MKHPSGRYFMLFLVAGISTGVLEPRPLPTQPGLEEYLDAEDWLQSGILLNGAGNYPDAAEAFSRCISIEPNNPFAWLNLGTAQALMGNYPEAIASLKKAIRLDPRLDLGFANLAEVYFKAERFGEAVEAYTALLAMWPEDSNAHYKRGLAYLLLNNAGQAQAEYLWLKIADPVLAGKLLQVIQQGTDPN